LSIDDRKKAFRYLLRSIFFDECEDIEDEKLIGFYLFLLESLEVRAEMHVNNDSDDYFVVGSIIHTLSYFHMYDTALLLLLAQNPDNFRVFVGERTGLHLTFVEEAMERAVGDFQDIKQGYLFTP
jgi:hypothetical protein